MHVSDFRHQLANRVKATSGHLGAGLHALLGSRATATLGILFYHRIMPHLPGIPAPGLNVIPSAFRRQLEGLLERGYTFLALRDVLSRLEQGYPLPEKAVVLTFDDGFASLFVHAWPILQDLQVPATVFVVTGYVDTEVPMPFDFWGMRYHTRTPSEAWRSLTWEECRVMEAAGLIEIGAHTHTHRDLRDDPVAFEADLTQCFDALQSHLGRTGPLFAFPFGDRGLGYVNDRLIEVVQRSGAPCALLTTTALVHPQENPFGWGRLEVVEQDTGATLAAKLEGWYTWVRHLRDLTHRVLPW
jgi:peptidoglycan/xylan/chitin deacetylase (PgdA/CDA1 family)